jgi:hypothetical protein
MPNFRELSFLTHCVLARQSETTNHAALDAVHPYVRVGRPHGFAGSTDEWNAGGINDLSELRHIVRVSEVVKGKRRVDRGGLTLGVNRAVYALLRQA